MANALLPAAERDLSPDQVAALDQRRSVGLTLIVISVQFLLVAVVLLLWVGQDLTYGPGWAHPMAYLFAISVVVCIVTGLVGMYLRKGASEF